MEQLSHFHFVIQARMNSQRFPGKVLQLLCGKSLLLNQIETLKGLGGERVTIATSDEEGDRAIVQFARDHQIDVYEGSESDVLSRYRDIAKTTDAQFLVRLTGDNPIICEKVLKTVLKKHLDTGAQYSSTREIDNQKVIRFIPKGWSIDIINVEAFKELEKIELVDFDKEHVIPAFYRLPIKRTIVKSFANLKLEDCTVDTAEDLEKLEKRVQERGGLNSYLELINSSFEE